MSYIPPHLRVSQGNKPKPSSTISEKTTTTTPYIPPHLRLLNSAASSSSSSTQHPPLPSSPVIHRHPHFAFGTSSDVMYRFIVLLPHEPMSFQHVKFARFKGLCYTHLQHLQLYTLTGADLDPAQQNVNEPTQRNPVNVIVQSLKEDLKEVLDKLGRFAHAESRDRMVPSILLRFGRNVFHDRRGYFDWGSSYTIENVKRNIQKQRLSKTFNVCLSREDFVFLHELARKDALHIKSEEAIIIQVEDKMRPDLLFECSLSEHNEESANPGKRDLDLLEITDSAKHVLELEEVTVPYPIRHMIGDIACVGKDRDIRLAFLMEEQEKPAGLTEMELCDLKSSFSKASIIDGPQHSTSGRFKVVRCSHSTTTVVIGGGLKWHLTSSGDSYYCVFVVPIICQEFCEGLKEWNTEMAILSIEELLQRVWADCL